MSTVLSEIQKLPLANLASAAEGILDSIAVPMGAKLDIVVTIQATLKVPLLPPLCGSITGSVTVEPGVAPMLSLPRNFQIQAK